MKVAARQARSTRAAVGVVLLGLLAAVGFGANLRASDGVRALWAIADPSDPTLRELAARTDLDVRWVESGLVVFESETDRSLPPAWRAQQIAMLQPGSKLGVLRAGDVAERTQSDPAHREHSNFIAAALAARLEAEAGEVWLVVAPAAQWPKDLLGCHGGLVLAKHGLDPRSLLDDGPPVALAPWIASAGRPLTAAERHVLADISGDSLDANLQRITLDALQRPADRFVRNDDLDEVYAPRVETVMQRAVNGLAGAAVTRQRFVPNDMMSTDTTYNVIARIPGSVPGTGTFVVCAHLDATGQRNPAWLADVQAGRPVQTPGAEDNASGVACVLELLRTTADAVRADQVDFAFDLEFVAYSAEEIGLWGSDYYVRRAVQAGTPLLGTLNFDMVGYDSLAGNLQVVHNRASRWLADWVVDASATLAPPTSLTLRPELDESRASDHNSFWNFNGPAILFADADVNTLRRYPTYHTPGDTYARPPTVLTRIQLPKLVEVSRVALAALLLFDTRAHTEPLLSFRPDNLDLLNEIQGVNVDYDPRFHRLWPGAPLSARMVVHSLGATFTGDVRILMTTTGEGGPHTVVDATETWSLPTGGRADFQRQVTIPGDAHGMQVLTASLEYADAGDNPIVQTASDTFFVQAPGELSVQLRPNPVRGNPEQSRVAVEVSAPGDVQVDVYDLEGQHVATNARGVVPVTFAKFEVPLVSTTSSGSLNDLASGAYVVRVQWRGTNGGSTTATARWVVIR